MEAEPGGGERGGQGDADAAVVVVVPDDLGGGGTGVEGEPVVDGLGGDVTDQLQDIVAVCGDGSGLNVDVAGGAARVIGGEEHAT